MRIIRNRKKKDSMVKNRRGQGATEYILMLAVLIAVIMVAKPRITSLIEANMNQADAKSATVW